ncbi:hypothetical protein DFH07DRAFT_997369 [Mycena maculata]|uniref:Uncharacterized protein n=1 Tax=Mycena maculata TaxID=230809 RepID=A0AAD7P0Z9_9AGAR|nr:hypothetical protein DFH07DRAFT_997369 [Mycena maculata]
MSSSLAGYPPPDVAHAIALIHAAAAPPPPPSASQSQNPHTQDAYIHSIQTVQSALLALQRTPAAWGLVLPLLARQRERAVLRCAHGAREGRAWGARFLVGGRAAAIVGRAGRAWVVRRKLYGGIVAIAVRLVPGRPGVWEVGDQGEGGEGGGWIGEVVGALVQAGAPSAHVHEFFGGGGRGCGCREFVAAAKGSPSFNPLWFYLCFIS